MEHLFFTLSVAAGFMLGGVSLSALRRRRRPQCRAWYTRPAESHIVMHSIQCMEDQYEHCDSGFCIIHCQEQGRCNGGCVKARRQLLLEAGR